MKDKGMKKVERSCRKLKMGNVAWSPQIQAVRDMIEYIKLTIRRKKGKNVSDRYLIRLSTKCGRNVQRYTISQLEQELHLQFKLYKEYKKDAKELRKSYIEYLAEAHEKAD